MYISNTKVGLGTTIWIAPIFIAEQENPGKTAEDGKKRKKNL